MTTADSIGSACDPPRRVVAVVLTCRGRVGLFRRSSFIRHEAGAWHCITGYLDDGIDPWEQAAQELYEETGLASGDLRQLTEGPTLHLSDPRGGPAWTVHTFAATTDRRRLTLNWENDAYRWVRPGRVPQLEGRVRWLDDVVAAIGRSTCTSGAAGSG